MQDRYLAPGQARLHSSELLPCQPLVGELHPGVAEDEAGYLCPALGGEIGQLDVRHVHVFDSWCSVVLSRLLCLGNDPAFIVFLGGKRVLMYVGN